MEPHVAAAELVAVTDPAVAVHGGEIPVVVAAGVETLAEDAELVDGAVSGDVGPAAGDVGPVVDDAALETTAAGYVVVVVVVGNVGVASVSVVVPNVVAVAVAIVAEPIQPANLQTWTGQRSAAVVVEIDNSFAEAVAESRQTMN